MINLANVKNINILNGSMLRAPIKPYSKVVYPENKELFLKVIKKPGYMKIFQVSITSK